MQLLCFRVSSCLRQPLLQKCSPHVLLENEVVFAICSTHIGGAPPPGAVPFFDALFDQSLLLSLKDVRFSVLGLGHSEYAEHYCKVMRPCTQRVATFVSHCGQAPKELDARLEALGGQRLAPIFLDDFGLFKEVCMRMCIVVFFWR
jgi:sulfite reductase alpha subunit-like flavoprotein